MVFQRQNIQRHPFFEFSLNSLNCYIFLKNNIKNVFKETNHVVTRSLFTVIINSWQPARSFQFDNQLVKVTILFGNTIKTKCKAVICIKIVTSKRITELNNENHKKKMEVLSIRSKNFIEKPI